MEIAEILNPEQFTGQNQLGKINGGIKELFDFRYEIEEKHKNIFSLLIYCK